MICRYRHIQPGCRRKSNNKPIRIILDKICKSITFAEVTGTITVGAYQSVSAAAQPKQAGCKNSLLHNDVEMITLLRDSPYVDSSVTFKELGPFLAV